MDCSIEVTFQEERVYLGVETTRGWIERDCNQLEPTWTGKSMVTFSDGITLVRREW